MEVLLEQNSETRLSNNDAGVDDSPEMPREKDLDQVDEERNLDDKEGIPSEDSISKALWGRASYIQSNTDKITMAGLRRLIEEDLNLEEYTLDSYKKFISEELDKVLKSFEAPQSQEEDMEKSSQKKKSVSVSKEECLGSPDRDVEEEEGQKPRKRIRKKTVSEGPKKRKRSEEPKSSRKKPAKSEMEVHPAENDKVDDSGGDSETTSRGYQSQSSTEKPKKETSGRVYGKRVEHLKSVIRSCGMSVSPAIYKRVKQVPEDKREARLIKELEGVLSKEGLSPNPSEKEIKDVRRKKERAKELEGIDLSNIVSSSRRRSAMAAVPPPKPEPVEADQFEDSDSDEDSHDSDEESDEEESEGIENGEKDIQEDSEDNGKEAKDIAEEESEGSQSDDASEESN